MKLLIVNFHYYREERYSSGIYPVNQAGLTSQLSEIAKQYDFISQQDLADCFNKQQFPKGNFCLITFDDGLKEQMQAFDLLQSKGIPAVFYVPAKPLVENKVLDVHKAHLIRTKLSDAELLKQLQQENNYSYSLDDEQKAQTQYKYDDVIAREVKFQLNFKLLPKQKEDFLDAIFQRIFGEEKDFSSSFYMDKKDLNQLAEKNQLGAHGYNHVPLAVTANPELDIKKSIDFLYQTTNKPVLSFSYPYGSTEAVNTHIASLVKAHQIKFALTMWRGLNDLNTETNPHLLLRIDTNDAPGGKLNSTAFII